METLWFLPFLGVLIFVCVGQVFSVYLNYDIKGNLGLVVLKFWGIRLLKISFELKKEGIVVHSNKKVSQMEYEFNDPKLKFVQDFSSEIKDKVKVKTFDLRGNYGGGDAAQTAMVCGVVDIGLKIIGAKIKNSKPTARVLTFCQPSFDKEQSAFWLYSKLSLTIFDVLYGLLVAHFVQNNT